MYSNIFIENKIAKKIKEFWEKRINMISKTYFEPESVYDATQISEMFSVDLKSVRKCRPI